MEGTLTLSVKLGNTDVYTVNAWSTDTVITVKELLVEQTTLQPKQMRLVFAGKVLNDEITLSFYRITNGSVLYLAPIKNAIKIRQNPKQMVIQLKTLLAESQKALPVSLKRISRQMKELISNKLLLSFASISSEAYEVIEQAQVEIEKIERLINDESAKYLAQAADSTIIQIEATSDGLRALQAIYNEGLIVEKKKEDFTQLDLTIIPEPAAGPSETPLPMIYSDRSVDYYYTSVSSSNDSEDEDNEIEHVRNRSTIKQKYAQQIEILKSMGYSDEQYILQALGESNGNIQLAVQILQNKSYFSY